MAQLSTKIKLYLGRKIDFTKDVVLRDKGDGVVYIDEWHVDEEQPTQEQLDALESEATILESNNQVITTRKNLYGTPEQQIENIMENGLDAEIARVNQIKLDNPKE